jgi:hypothetical protein
MLASAATAMRMCRESEAERAAHDREVRELLAMASEFETGRGGGGARGEVDDGAIARRTQSMVRHRSRENLEEAMMEDANCAIPRRRASEDMTEAVVPPPPLDPPARFVRRPRAVRPDTPLQEGAGGEPRTLLVSASYRTAAPPVRTVRWGRKRKPDVTWEDVPRSAVGRGARARALAGSVAYT